MGIETQLGYAPFKDHSLKMNYARVLKVIALQFLVKTTEYTQRSWVLAYRTFLLRLVQISLSLGVQLPPPPSNLSEPWDMSSLLYNKNTVSMFQNYENKMYAAPQSEGGTYILLKTFFFSKCLNLLAVFTGILQM